MTAVAASHSSDAGLGPEADGERHADDERRRHQVAQQAGHDVAGQHRRAADRHRAEAVHDAGDLVLHTPTAVPAAPKMAHSTMMPGTT